MVANTNADCAIVNGGMFRSDQVQKAGVFTLRDLTKILCFNDICVVVEVKGFQLAQALEMELENILNLKADSIK